MTYEMIEAHPAEAADPAVIALAHDLLVNMYSTSETEAKVHAVAHATGFDSSILWDVLPDLCSKEADAHYEARTKVKR